MSLIVLNLVKRTEYKRLRQGEIGDYVEKLLTRGVGATFEPFRTILDDLGRLNVDYIAKLAAVESGGKAAREAKDLAKKMLINQIDIYANGIDTAAVSDPAIITLAGFQHRTIDNTKRTSGALPSPTKVSLKPDSEIPGKIILKIEVGTWGYSWAFQVETRILPDGEWTYALTDSVKKMTLEGFAIGDRVQVRVMITGKSGRSSYVLSNEVYISPIS